MADRTHLVRDPTVMVVSSSDACMVFARGAPALVIGDVDGQAIAELLELAVRPLPVTALAERASEEALALLVEHGVLWQGSPEELEARLPRREPIGAVRRCRRIVVGISGAVSAAGSLDQVILLSQTLAGEVDVVLTAGAIKFVQPGVFESWGFRTWTDQPDARNDRRDPVQHLAAAELVLIAPASAGILHRLASGAGSDLLSRVVVATAAPVVVAPVMNSHMWRNPAVARNVAQLRRDGVWIIEPGLGFEMASRDRGGDVGGPGYRYHPTGVVDALACILDRPR